MDDTGKATVATQGELAPGARPGGQAAVLAPPAPRAGRVGGARTPQALVAIAAILAGCATELAPTGAELRAPAGDITSCHRTQDASGCGPDVACSGTLAACVDAGCAIGGGGLVVYPDGSWRAPDPGPGTWAIERVSDTRVRLVAGDLSLLVAERGSPAYDRCP